MFDLTIQLGVVVLTGAALAVGWKVGARVGDAAVEAGENAFTRLWPNAGKKAVEAPAAPHLAAA